MLYYQNKKSFVFIQVMAYDVDLFEYDYNNEREYDVDKDDFDDELVVIHIIYFHKIVHMLYQHSVIYNLQEILKNYKQVENKHLQEKFSIQNHLFFLVTYYSIKLLLHNYN